MFINLILKSVQTGSSPIITPNWSSLASLIATTGSLITVRYLGPHPLTKLARIMFRCQTILVITLVHENDKGLYINTLGPSGPVTI